MNSASKGRSWWALALIYCGYMLLFADRTVFNLSLASMAQTFSLNAGTMGLASSLFFLGYTLMQIPGGYLSDRWGSRWLIIGSLVAFSALTLGTGIVASAGVLLVLRFLFGLAEGPYPAAALKQVGSDFAPKKRSQITGLLISSNYAGATLAPFVIVPILAASGWRHAFFWMGLVGLVIAVIFWLSERRRLRADQAPRSQAKIVWREIDPRVWWFVVMGLALNIITKGLETWMPVYFLTRLHVKLANLTWLVPLPTIAGGIAAALSGWLLVKVFAHKERMLLISASLLTLISMLGLYWANNLAQLVVCDVLLYFFKSLVFTGIFGFIAQILSQAKYGSNVGIVNVGGQLGGFFGPLVIGWLVQLTTSYQAAFLGLVVSAVVAAGASLFVGNLKVNSQK